MTNKPSTSPTPARGSFEAFLRNIRQAKERLQLDSGHLSAVPATSASLTVVWEAFFDTLCQQPSLEDLNQAAGVVQKLTSAFNHVLSHDLKERERQERKEALAQTVQRSSDMLPPEVLDRIEKQLRLL